MASASKPKKSLLDKIRQDDQSSSYAPGSSRDTNKSTVHTTRSVPDDYGAQIHSQGPTPSLTVTAAGMKAKTAPATKVSALVPPSVMSRYADRISRTDTGGNFSNEIKPPRMMDYPAHSIAPETPKELSIYPVTDRMLKAPAHEESIDPHIGPGQWNSQDPEFNLQYQVKKESDRLWAEKHTKMLFPLRPATATSEDKSRLYRNTGHQNDVKKPDGDPTPRKKTEDTRNVLHESMDWGDAATTNSDTEFSIFDGAPRDQSLLSETEEWLLPPWEPPEAEHDPSLSTLSSMKEWDPKIDLDFQNEARENLDRWSDCRFKIPQTPADVESLQQALEITRMDFWIRNPREIYPEDLSQYHQESYGSQHRRLQHAFCRIWRDSGRKSPPELYRLPTWMFGFEYCYWKPSSWGFDKRSNAYNQGLAEMAAEKKKKGLHSLHYQNWKARLKEPVIAATA